MKRLSGFNYEIVRNCGVISQVGIVTKELNVIRYNSMPARYDLRAWETDPEDGTRKMRKGLTFTGEELIFLRDLLNGMDLDTQLEEAEDTDPKFDFKPF
jgi:hypothetical protein